MNKDTELLICGYNKNTSTVIISKITDMDSNIDMGRLIFVVCVFLDINTFCSKNFTNKFRTNAMPNPMKSGLIIFNK